jgi:hypothetical protein
MSPSSAVQYTVQRTIAEDHVQESSELAHTGRCLFCSDRLKAPAGRSPLVLIASGGLLRHACSCTRASLCTGLVKGVLPHSDRPFRLLPMDVVDRVSAETRAPVVHTGPCVPLAVPDTRRRARRTNGVHATSHISVFVSIALQRLGRTGCSNQAA